MVEEEKNTEITDILSDIPPQRVAIIESLLVEKNSKIQAQESKILALEKEVNWFKEQFRRQDIATNIDIYSKYGSTLFIREELYLYRCENSSYEYN